MGICVKIYATETILSTIKFDENHKIKHCLSMINIPVDWKKQMVNQLSEFELERLTKSLSTEATRAVRLHPKKWTVDTELANTQNVPWCPTGRYVMDKIKWSQQPEFAAGAVYPQEASSMSLWHILGQLDVDWSAARVLDACAAPGGKSTLILDFLADRGMLIANDIDPVRASVLSQNIGKWGYANCVVTNNHPGDFRVLENEFDVVCIDAPCSGEGLWRKTPAAVNEWSVANVEYCALRQWDIVRDILPSVKLGGFVIYSTCTYNPMENEEIIKKMEDEFGVKPVEINWDLGWNVTETNAGCYHFYPHKTRGEGLFVCVLQKLVDESEVTPLPPEKGVSHRLGGFSESNVVDKPEKTEIPYYKTKHKNHKKTRFQTLRGKEFKPQFIVQKLKQQPNFLKTFFENPAFELREFREEIFATPHNLLEDIEQYSTLLKVVKPGLRIGKLTKKGDGWILQPNNDLAWSVQENLAKIATKELSEMEWQTWQKTGIVKRDGSQKTQWTLLAKNGLAVGWAKV